MEERTIDQEQLVTSNTDKECWQDICSSMKNFPFTETNRMLVDLPAEAKPYDYFRLFVDNGFLENIITETNKYAENLFLSRCGNERSRITDWKDLKEEELLKFIGLVYHMGNVKLNKLQDYWRTSRLFNFKCFADHMSRDRFLVILRSLHFSTNPEPNQPEPNDRLYKIRPVINYFNTKMKDLYYPGKNLSLDESMVLWRGRLLFRQYIANKRHKYGLKLYMLTEPNGLILNFAVYTGQLDEMGGKGHAQKVVQYIAKDYLNKGHSIYMENYYNSCQLARTLINHKTYCTGTLRSDRKGGPEKILKMKLKVGESKAQYSDGVMIGKWKDKRDVTYISTEFENQMVEITNKRGVAKQKPLPIVEYNKCMGGIDHQDQMMSYYPSLRKTLFWYKKLGVHILQLLLFNSYVIFCKYSGRKMTFYDYRLAVIEKLLPDIPRRIEYKVSKHVPSKIDAVDATKRTPRKRCRLCFQNKIRKDTV